MADSLKPPNPVQFLNELSRNEEIKHQPIIPTGLDPRLAMLRGWQSDRLRRTYRDLLADARYTPACEFFLSEIYAPRDFSQRDHDLDRIHGVLSRILPAHSILLLSETVELNGMTHTLDQRLLSALVEQLGVTDKITPELYARAYRLCDNYPERVRQIDLTRRLLMQVGEMAHRKTVGGVLKLAKIPAQRAGWVDLYDFLDRGRRAFMQMKDVKTFVETIAWREMKLLDLVYAADQQGFERLAGFGDNLAGRLSQ